MSCWVRSSQIVRYRSAHALPVVVSIWQAATLAVVSLSKASAPPWVKVTLTTQPMPF